MARRTSRRIIPRGSSVPTHEVLFEPPSKVRLRRGREVKMNATDRTELLRLLARESYFERELTLASGRASNFYIDCKSTLYLPRGAHLAGALMLELVMAEGIGQIGGMAAGALPVTDAIVNAAFDRGYDV